MGLTVLRPSILNLLQSVSSVIIMFDGLLLKVRQLFYSKLRQFYYKVRSMVQHLGRDPQKVKMCSDIITEQEKRVFMERVTHPETTVGTCHYLPHHAVFKESATTPIRVVCKCSCRQSQEHPRLNDSLLPGPPITNDLTAILPRFPRHKYGFATDI